MALGGSRYGHFPGFCETAAYRAMGCGDGGYRMKRLMRLIRVLGFAMPFAWLALSGAAFVEAAPSVGFKHQGMAKADAAVHRRITVVDDFGRSVTVRYPPQRIVSLAPAATAMLSAAGAGTELVGTIE